MNINGTLNVDFHIHTKEDPYDSVSYDAKELVDIMAEKGITVFSITNHEKITYNNDLKKYAEDRGILLIPGVEAIIEGKHVIIINIYKYYEGMFKSLSDLKSLNGNGTLVIAPHPFFPSFRCLRSKLVSYIEYFDAIEYSHYYIESLNFNNKAEALSMSVNKPLVGTSDAHYIWQISKTYSKIKASKDTESIVNAVKNSNVEVVTAPLSKKEFFGFMVDVMVKNLKF